MSEFCTLGPVPLDSLAYIPRTFEDAIFRETVSGRWVLLLGPRQHGKTTGFGRLRVRLHDAGISVAKVDLQGLPPGLNYVETLRWVTDQLSASVGRPPTQPGGHADVLAWLTDLWPTGLEPVVVFIDEAASMRDLASRNAFYGQIRQIANLRAETTPNQLPHRLRFVFGGTFRPETLIDPLNSPFNVCVRIETDDLSFEQAQLLATNVAPEIHDATTEVYEIVGGQPYLLQTAFDYVARAGATNQEVLQRLHNELPHAVDAHLQSLFRPIVEEAGLSAKVSAMLRNESAELVPADSDCSFLKVVGVAKRSGTKLVFRNRLYRNAAERFATAR